MATPITEERVYQALRNVIDPELRHNVVDLGFIQEIDIVGDYVHLEVQLTTPHCPFADQIVRDIRDAVTAIEGVAKVEVERTCMKGE
ncbi:MAG: metal-sulfur cluster assembly factor [Acidiferrobacterales bacterium]